MKIQQVEKIEDLSDIFYALMGGKPEKVSELDDFINQSPLKELIHAADVRNILEFDAFFPDETVDGVYALLPVKIPLSNERQLVLTPGAFRRFNQQRIARPASRSINVPFPKAMSIYQNLYGAKIDAVEKAIEDIKRKQAAKAAEAARLAKIAEEERAARIAEAHRLLQEAEERKRARIEAEQKAAAEAARIEAEQKAVAEAKEAARREKNRLRMQAYRAEHPEKRKSYYKRLDTLPAKERKKQRAANNRRNQVYREKNRERLRQSHNERRAKMKRENPELLKELDKIHNASAARRLSGSRYYQKHKEEINAKARNNPMVKIYKQRYKIKQRLQKTGPQILSLVEGIALAKLTTR